MTTNEAVAKACGFTATHNDGRKGVFIEEWCGGMQVCEFDADPAAAVFALDEYTDSGHLRSSVSYCPHEVKSYRCKIVGVGVRVLARVLADVRDNSRQAAICAAILAAEEQRAAVR